MKKVEAQAIAPDKSRLLLEYIAQFMSYEGVIGKILIDSDKDPDTHQLMCYIEIILDDGFERHYKTGITADQSDVLSEQILIDLAETYAQDKEVEISRLFTLHSTMNSMKKVNIMNKKGSIITLNFLCRGPAFDRVVESYSRKLSEEQNKIATPKRGRGRPRKVQPEETKQNVEEQNGNISLFDLANDEEETEQNDVILPGFEEDSSNQEPEKEEVINVLPGFETEEDDVDNDDDGFIHADSNTNNFFGSNNTNNTSTQKDYFSHNEEPSTNEIVSGNNSYQSISIENLLTRDKKIVSFVGTTKNGTSFLINNLAEMFSSMGINTAILDATKNKNSYYIYTKNEETLRKVASNSMENLANGIPEGIKVNRSLTVYTSLPTEIPNENVEKILATLVKNYSLVLIDCDFDTDISYFKNSQEIYLVQSMDILTIQPLTAFLRELKAKDVLSQEKIRIVVNKQARVRTLNSKVIIGGMAFYNDPSMSFMTELFNKDNVRSCNIPFDEQVYSRYLEGLVNCNVSLNGYTKNFMTALKELGNMVYPLLNNKYKPVESYERKNAFSSRTSNTLEQMKNNY